LYICIVGVFTRAINSDDDEDLQDLQFNEDGSISIVNIAMGKRALTKMLMEYAQFCTMAQAPSNKEGNPHHLNRETARTAYRTFLASRHHVNGWIERGRAQHGFKGMRVQLRIGPIPMDEELGDCFSSVTHHNYPL